MIQLCGFLKGNPQHYKICDYCKAIVGFSNEDIDIDDMGTEIICPNCHKPIRF